MPQFDKQLLERIRHNDPTLTTLHLGHNQIGDTCLQEIDSFIQQNTQALLKRRQEFIYKIILLARDAKNLHSDSLWRRLPHELRLLVFSFLNFRGETTIGKTTKQIVHCAQFIVAKGDECNGLIKAKQKIQLLEKVDSKGNYGFQFFKSLKENSKVSQKQDSRVKHCVLS